ncbi:MAG: hypothetical protein Q7R39_17330 [Dehalococcoidia bacterium]|nr:hypothetical protein [Dehalococcoidia bacterium]
MAGFTQKYGAHDLDPASWATGDVNAGITREKQRKKWERAWSAHHAGVL